MKPSNYSLNYIEPIIIRRKKSRVILVLLFYLSISLFIIYGIFIILSGDAPLVLKLSSPIYFLFPLFIFKYTINSLKKILSKNPEYKITEGRLILYDHPRYESISFEDMIACELHSDEGDIIII